MSTKPPSPETVELRRTILEALDPILDEEEASDAAIAAADAILNPSGLGTEPTAQDDIVDHELLAAHDQIAQLRRELDTMRAARDAIARDFLAASQAEQRAYRERDDARSAGLAWKRDRDRWKARALSAGVPEAPDEPPAETEAWIKAQEAAS